MLWLLENRALRKISGPQKELEKRNWWGRYIMRRLAICPHKF
jgi:hypothetical protein